MSRKVIVFISIIALLVLSTHIAFAAEAGETSGGSSTGMGIGLKAIGASLSIGLSSIAAGIAVGRTGSAAIGAISEKPELFGKSIVFVGLSEGIAIYGLLIAILILFTG